jgi:hypothetical protein
MFKCHLYIPKVNCEPISNLSYVVLLFETVVAPSLRSQLI